MSAYFLYFFTLDMSIGGTSGKVTPRLGQRWGHFGGILRGGGEGVTTTLTDTRGSFRKCATLYGMAFFYPERNFTNWYVYVIKFSIKKLPLKRAGQGD